MFRRSTYLEHHQIVEPGQSDKAAFDAEAYHKAMRDGRSEGMVHYLAAFIGGGVLGLVLSYGFSAGTRAIIAVVAGVAVAGVLHRVRLAKLSQSNSEAVVLHAKAHELEMIANQIEIERAKAAGAFDRWEKS